MLKIRKYSPMFKNIGLTVVGTLILAFGTAVFIIPFDLVVGGMSGFAIVLEKIIPFEFVTVDLLITVMSWSLFLTGFLILGKSFAAKTLISTVIYPPFITLFSKLTSPDVMGGVLCLENSPHTDVVLLISALFGGVLIGLGCSVAFLGGGSTGGTDVIAFVICKFAKRLRSSVVIFIVDSLPIILGIFILNDLVLTLIGIISVFVSALMVDKIFVGGQKALTAQIISEKHSEINQEIIEKLERTTTLVEVTGGYSKTSKTMLMVTFSMRQYSELLNIVNRNDNNAFVTITKAHEINGRGWTR